jgi:hypothetical protein
VPFLRAGLVFRGGELTKKDVPFYAVVGLGWAVARERVATVPVPLQPLALTDPVGPRRTPTNGGGGSVGGTR